MADFDINSEIMEKKRLEGKALCEKYVLGNIPPEEVAKFLGVNIESLKAAIQQNSCPFAIPYKIGVTDQRRCIIPAIRFWDWIKCKL